MPIVYPIAPALDEQGRLTALLPFVGDGSAVPVKPGPFTGTWEFSVEELQDSTDVYAQLGVCSAFNAKSTVSSTTLMWDMMVGKNAVLATPAPNDVIYETFWGVGLRVALTFTSTDISSSTNVAVVAASAEFKSVDVQYEVHAVGLGPAELASVLETIPPLGRFDLTAYSLLDSVRTTLTKTLIAGLPTTGDLTQVLRPVQVKLSMKPLADAFQDAAAYRFTMQSIMEGLSLAETKDAAKQGDWKDLPLDRVEAIFKATVGGDGAPDASASDKAQSWLDVG